ncbi:MAG: hypothetical protein GY842_13080 [bacterium]|nr:hypothetical protein [bacterium]
MNCPVSIVSLVDSHLPFVFSSWIAEWRKEHPSVDSNWLAVAQHAMISKLLDQPSVITLVAVNPDNHDQIAGYIVAEPERRVLHWLYTRGRYRKARVASQLLQEAFGDPSEPVEVTGITHRLRWFQRWRLVPRTYRLCEAMR